jgi:hypothetical protein
LKVCGLSALEPQTSKPEVWAALAAPPCLASLTGVYSEDVGLKSVHALHMYSDIRKSGCARQAAHMTEKDDTPPTDPFECALLLPSRIKNASLLPVAAAFKESVETVDFLKITPQALLSHGYAEAASFEFFRKLAKTDDIRVSPGIHDSTSAFEDWFSQVRCRVESIAATEEAQKEFRKHLWETANRQIATLLKDKHVASALRSLTLARVVLGWTAFECLAIDGWETALNESAVGLGQPAFKHVSIESGTDEGITARHVPVGLLAKHGFDLRKKLGTVLRTKFDFTSVAGIRQAYKAAFGDQDTLARILGDQKLTHLEGARHLIVHRGGLVDEEFVRRTDSTFPIGQAIPLDNEEIASLLDAMMTAGCRLLTFVDECLRTSLSNDP